MAHKRVVWAASLTILFAVVVIVPVTSETSDDISSIDFSQVIGAPLQAAVDAQAQAALTLIDFVDQVGFSPPASTSGSTLREPRMLSFGFSTTDSDGLPRSGSISVPLLGLVPLPTLQISEVDMEFHAKVTKLSPTTDTVTTQSALDLGSANRFSAFRGTSMKATLAQQSQSSFSAQRTMSEYSMNVKIKAERVPLPPAAEKLLTHVMSHSFSTALHPVAVAPVSTGNIDESGGSGGNSTSTNP